MRLWGKRKKSQRGTGKSLSLEKLEDRAMMTAIPLVSGQAISFHDADGTLVTVRLKGPGEGALELANGLATGAAIETLTLTGTTGASKLKISTRGGSEKGTTINQLVIEKALGEVAALGSFKGRNVDFADDGEFTADGDVGKLKMHSLGTDASIEVSGVLQRFVSQMLEPGSDVSAEQLDMLKIKRQAVGATIDVGDGGLAHARIKNIYGSNIAANGNIGEIKFNGDAMGVSLASNIDAGSDGIYGTIDDFVIDRAMAGDVSSVKFRGYLGAKGTSQEVDIVTSGQVGQVSMSRRAHDSGGGPAMWEDAAQQIFPLSIVQEVASATGYADDQVWIAVYGTESGTGSKAGNNYYLASDSVKDGIPVLQQTSPTPSSSTPNLPILNSYTLKDWKAASQTWGSNLAFPVPREGNQWSGRILISVGAPVQAQINGDGSIAAPSANNATDPSTGTFYDFLEFTISGKTVKNGITNPPNLDIDTSLVDEFGIPMALELFQQNPGVTQFTGTLTAGSNMISGVASTTGLAQGQSLVGEHIPLGTTITAVGDNSVTISTNADPGASGSESLMAVAWDSFDVQISGTIDPSSNMITGINSTSLNNLIKNSYVGKHQPVTAAGVLPDGTTIEDYVIGSGNDGTITLTRDSLSSVAPNSTVTFTISPAGAVGVEADRQDITSGANTDGLTYFLQQLIQGGNSQARPFLQTSAPFLANGPAVIYGVSSGAAPIIVTAPGTGGLVAGNVVQIDGVPGNTAANGVFAVVSPGPNSFTLGSPIANGTYTSGGTWSSITPYGITNATDSAGEVMITAPTTGLSNGDTVVVAGVVGNTGANGTFTVANVTATTFTLSGSTSAGTYAYGGYWYQQPTSSTPITGASNGAITISTASTGSLAANDFVLVSGVGGNTAANGVFQVGTVTPNASFELAGPLANGGYAGQGTWSLAVTDAATDSMTGEIIITTANTTGLADGDLVEVTGVEGNTAANNIFFVTNVTPTSFTLQGSTSGGTYTRGGTWKQYAALTRLISPKDLVELLESPQDPSALNNYFNEQIDQFFLNYYTGTINSQTGGGQTLNLVSTTFKGQPITYSGTVQQVTIDNAASMQQYSGYALQLKDLSGTDPTVYNIVYPFFTTNAPATEIYSPVFGTAAPPTWLVTNTQQFESASRMIFACDAVFADNKERVGIDLNSGNEAVIADLENSISAAFNRGIVMNDPSTWSDSTQWFPSGGTYNYWTQYWHQDGLTFNDLAYAFSYDDRFGTSTQPADSRSRLDANHARPMEPNAGV